MAALRDPHDVAQLRRAFAACDAAVAAALASQPPLVAATAGATALVAVVDPPAHPCGRARAALRSAGRLTRWLTRGPRGSLVGRRVTVAHVGDSRALLLRRGRRPVLALTRDHVPTLPEEHARIAACGGHVWLAGTPRVNGVLAVSRAFCALPLRGSGVIAEPDVFSLRVHGDDGALLLATDGAFEQLTPAAAASAILQPGATPADAADVLVDEALARGAKDNISGVIVPLLGWDAACRGSSGGRSPDPDEANPASMLANAWIAGSRH